MRIEGLVAVVTGRAFGLGEAIVRHLHALRAQVAVADPNGTAGGTLVALLGPKALYAPTDEVLVRSAVAAATTLGQLGLLMNCAGIGIAQKALGPDAPPLLADMARVVHVNLIGTYNAIRLAAGAMRRVAPGSKRKRGVIAATVSAVAFEGGIGLATCSAPKGGVDSMTLPFARDFARHDTPMLSRLPGGAPPSQGAQVAFAQRLGRPEEYAELVLQIVRNRMLCATTLRLDGPLRMGAR